ncbi:alpha/beta hydrolase [Paenibacillus septentrionalis]|uniref:Alpha/beta hydrolase n=1 Tax=Paenibacillus septentrionalis TaxID=429342 RepID=A0ABW1UZS9_9BACL
MTETVKKRKWPKIVAWVGIILVIIVVAVLVYLNSATYAPSAAAEAAFQSDNKVTVTEVKDGFKFEPEDGNVVQPNIIFYPGGLVEPESYSTFARALAELGHRVYIAEMPFNLAIFGQNKAQSFINEYPDEAFVIGGHSLGGAFAARFASENADALKGVYFMASYADEGGSLKDSGLPILQITGTDDGVLNQEVWEESKTNLPTTETVFVSIDGGNHGQFGSYGMQKGDKEAGIEEQEQLESVIAAMQNWISDMVF